MVITDRLNYKRQINQRALFQFTKLPVLFSNLRFQQFTISNSVTRDIRNH